MKSDPVNTVSKAVAPLWTEIKELFTQHHFLTIVCGFFAILMILSFYRFLRSISPALVAVLGMLLIVILLLHWTQTRTEPAFLKPVVDWLAPFFPSPNPPRIRD